MKTYLICARWSGYRSGFSETYVVSAMDESEAREKAEKVCQKASYIHIIEIDINEPYLVYDD